MLCRFSYVSAFFNIIFTGVIDLKKPISVMLVLAVMCVVLTGCSKKEYMNIAYFTDNLNSNKQEAKVQMSDYYIKDNIYTLPVARENKTVIMRAVTDENGDIGEIRVTVAKTDEKGKKTKIFDWETA